LIIFNEKEYAEKMLTNGFLQKNKLFHELLILAKYLFYIGKDKTQIRQDLMEFCEKHVEKFNKVLHLKLIIRVITVAEKSELRNDKQVNITLNEIKKIKELENLNEEKIVFIMLVIYKIYKNHSFEISMDELFRLANIKMNASNRTILIQSLIQKKYIDLNYYCEFIVKISDIDEPIMIINDFSNFVLEYQKFIGDNIGNCINCNKLIEIKSNRKKYCRDCAKEIKKQLDKERMKGNRNSRK
jgi:hypothetical protein